MFSTKITPNGKWTICEGDEVSGCAGEWDTEAEADEVAEMLNELSK